MLLLPTLLVGARSFLSRSACRHAVRAISSRDSHRGSGVWSLRIPEPIRPPVFPADCPHLADFHCRRLRGEYRRIHRVSQHIARFRFRNYSGPAYSYGRRLPGLRFKASHLAALTSLLNLPAPGRRQTLYLLLRVGRVLCF
jgi:hypothetical protein